MQFNSARLLFIEINPDDLKDIHHLHSFPEVEEFNTIGIPENLEVTQKLMQPDIDDQQKSTRSRFCFKIVLSDTKEFIGLSGLSLSNDRFKIGEFYYKLLPVHWGKGYATEIAKRIIEFGFKECKLHRIEAGVATQNKASIRVLEKAGMIREGLHRKILPIRGEWKDNYHYAMVEDDFH